MDEKAFVSPSSQQLKERDWGIFKNKLEKLIARQMHLSIGRVLAIGCYDENEFRKKDEGFRDYGARAANLFFHKIFSCNPDLALESDFLEAYQQRNMNRSINSVINSPAAKVKSSSNVYHAAVYFIDKGYKRDDEQANPREVEGLAGLGWLACDIAMGSSNYREFETSLRKKLLE